MIGDGTQMTLMEQIYADSFIMDAFCICHVALVETSHVAHEKVLCETPRLTLGVTDTSVDICHICVICVP